MEEGPGAAERCWRPSAEFREEVCAQAARICRDLERKGLRALILTGSLARDEATWAMSETDWKSYGDAEFLMVFENRVALPAPALISRRVAAIEDSLRVRHIVCPIELTPVPSTYLKKLQPAIFAYELRACGQVAWGDPAILSLIPPFAISDIPEEDAWRLLCNRMIECLEAAADVPSQGGPAWEKLGYCVTKLCLDMATSFLVFAGAYQPSYGKRAEALRTLTSGTGKPAEFPFPLREFSRLVDHCTGLKLGLAQTGYQETGRTLLEPIVGLAHQLWRWELARMTGAQGDLTDAELLESWMRLQKSRQRLRGWLVVLRECGRAKGVRNWLSWLRLWRRASPRYLVYEVASELFFCLPGLMDDSSAAPADWSRLSDRLPVRWAVEHKGERTWVGLARQCALNYHGLLERTRA